LEFWKSAESYKLCMELTEQWVSFRSP